MPLLNWIAEHETFIVILVLIWAFAYIIPRVAAAEATKSVTRHMR